MKSLGEWGLVADYFGRRGSLQDLVDVRKLISFIIPVSLAEFFLWVTPMFIITCYFSVCTIRTTEYIATDWH